MESNLIYLVIFNKGGGLASIEVRATFIEEIRNKQFKDKIFNDLKKHTFIVKEQGKTLDV